ncbi:MAG TPA: hypothetical protein VHQ47_11445, partial [Phycisphaerae bacterium]|nr:hypothetical protein [Phycisphaerae bacterium]
LLGVAGMESIAHDPSGDAGGPLIVLGLFAVMGVASLVIGLLAVVGLVLGAVGLWRTRWRCWWSWVGMGLHVIWVVGVVLVWVFG